MYDYSKHHPKLEEALDKHFDEHHMPRHMGSYGYDSGPLSNNGIVNYSRGKKGTPGHENIHHNIITESWTHRHSNGVTKGVGADTLKAHITAHNKKLGIKPYVPTHAFQGPYVPPSQHEEEPASYLDQLKAGKAPHECSQFAEYNSVSGKDIVQAHGYEPHKRVGGMFEHPEGHRVTFDKNGWTHEHKNGLTTTHKPSSHEKRMELLQYHLSNLHK
jgi:hypothetical protein